MKTNIRVRIKLLEIGINELQFAEMLGVPKAALYNAMCIEWPSSVQNAAIKYIETGDEKEFVVHFIKKHSNRNRYTPEKYANAICKYLEATEKHMEEEERCEFEKVIEIIKSTELREFLDNN